MGEFNFDLLNYETDTGTAGFLNSIVQFGFLPLIHQPTRITDRSAIIIDNIFANNFEHESISGNLLLNISDHLPQFSIIKKLQLDHKAFNNYKHDYHKFDEDLFKDDFQIQDWSNLERSDLDSSQNLTIFTGDYLLCGKTCSINKGWKKALQTCSKTMGFSLNTKNDHS